jgi:glycosyltransferase involved in cell wall biosynthesis
MAIISVVVTSVTGLPAIDRCLKALVNQQNDFECEVIAVVSNQPGAAEYVRKNFPGVKLIECAERKGIPELRAIGASQSAGEFVAFTEDRCVADVNWLSEILRAHQSGFDVAGGAIEPDGIRGPINWAVYLCEYCFLMLPVPHGFVAGVGGNNVSYRRELLAGIDEPLRKSSWEFFWYEELRQRRVKVFSTPAIIVRKKIEFGFLYFLTQRFHFSRSFAGMRRERIPAARRLVHLLSAPLLPPLLLWRIARQVFNKKRFRKEFLLSLPALAMFMLSYAAGEFVGYLLGGGDSLLKVE